MATKATEKKASKKTTKKAQKPKAKPKAKPAKKAAKPKAAQAAAQKPKARREARRFPRGKSPFSSPVSGTTVYSKETDVTRKVVSLSGTGFVTIEETAPATEAKTKTIGIGAWAQWCSRNKAEVVDQEQPTIPAEAVADSPAEEAAVASVE